MTDKELERIYNEAYRVVYWTAMQLLKNEADAEDVVQDSFIAFIESYSDIKDTTRLRLCLRGSLQISVWTELSSRKQITLMMSSLTVLRLFRRISFLIPSWSQKMRAGSS